MEQLLYRGIEDLPNEILRQIIQYVLDDEEDDPEYYCRLDCDKTVGPNNRRQLGQINRRFRQVLFSLPAVWYHHKKWREDDEGRNDDEDEEHNGS